MDVENWNLEILEAIVRKIPFARHAYTIFMSLASFLSALGTVFEWFGIPKQAYGVSTLLLVLVASPSFVAIAIAGFRKKKLRRVLDTLDELTSLQKNSFSYDSVKRRYMIQHSGDSVCTRDAEIRSNGEPIRAEQISFGATPEGHPVKNFEELKFSVVDTKARVPMKNIVLSDDERRKRVVILFPTPARMEKVIAYTISYVWPKLWTPLLTNGRDYGCVNVKTRTKHMTLEVQVPNGVYIEQFNVVPDVGSIEICKGKSMIIWTVDNPEESTYRYELICSKIPNADVTTD